MKFRRNTRVPATVSVVDHDAIDRLLKDLIIFQRERRGAAAREIYTMYAQTGGKHRAEVDA